MMLSNSCYNAYDVKRKKKEKKEEEKKKKKRDRYELKFQVTLISYPGLDS